MKPPSFPPPTQFLEIYNTTIKTLTKASTLLDTRPRSLPRTARCPLIGIAVVRTMYVLGFMSRDPLYRCVLMV